MGFWIFMTMCSMLVPVLMIVVGSYFPKHPPGKINRMVGYRTARSMKSKEAWDFAQVYFAKLWQKAGWILLVCAVLAMLSVMGKSENVVSLVGLAAEAVELAVLIASVIPVERALKKKFP